LSAIQQCNYDMQDENVTKFNLIRQIK
jgi:hypothetical protein